MENEIIYMLKKQKLSFEKIYEKLLNIVDINEDDVKKTINNLTKQKKIFLDSKMKYNLITEDKIIARLSKCSKNTKYIIDNGEKIIISPENLHTAFKDDLVVVERIGRYEGKVIGILERKNNKLVCEVKEKNDKLILVPFNGNCEISIIPTKECNKILQNLIIGDRVFVTIDNTLDDENTVLATNITKIGHNLDKNSDEVAIAISKGFNIEFNEDVLNEVKNTPKTVRKIDKQNRVDLTNETIFTIDSISTKDMDDAVSIKKLSNGNYELSVHIADVSHYLKPNTELFREALRRATSVYIGDVVIPMIPSELSNGICSLNEDVERLTKTVVMEINKRGKIVNSKIFDSVIKSNKKMTYEDLNKIFKSGIYTEDYIKYKDDLELMRELSTIITKNRYNLGNLEFESSDMKIHTDKLNNLEFSISNQDEAEMLIENFMIAANQTVASHFYWSELPFIYRTHSTPDINKLENTLDVITNLGYKTRLQNAYDQKAIQNILNDYKGKKEYSVISNLLLRNMAKAKYSIDNEGHYALALNEYCHFTSPIRRFPDLIVHTLINIFINNYSMNNYDKALISELDELANHSSFKERQAADAEKDYIKLKMAEEMAKHIDEEFEGIILDISPENVYIKLDNNIKGILDIDGEFSEAFHVDITKRELKCNYSKTKLKLGTRVKVKVTYVDIPQKEIYFDVKEIIKENDHKNVKKLELKYELVNKK
ncbi:MAG: VacB/RNase II family 3'-5' exoribonuclease [Bacilli bacterium]|nr:VacB/RNase II family 3'-5' exoribonuclease [Bacilli bacterium]